MRLFKRQSSDTSPQLVSATPLSQDGATPLAIVDENSERIAKKSQNENEGLERVSVKENVSDSPKPSSSQSCVSNRKGISTWGRKVGRRWDQLKRSDSSELLSVSGRRRRWSPNRKSCGNVTDEKENGASESPELPKPKRISRVESLRNLFRSSERNNNLLGGDVSTRNVTIHEEDVTCISHYPMEKALSDGAIKNVPSRVTLDDSRVDRGSSLHERKKQLSRSIHDLQEQQRVLDYILKNQDILKTNEGSSFARETLDKVRRSASPKRRTSQTASDASKSSVSTQTRDFLSNQINNIKKNLFNARPNSSECDRGDAQRSYPTTGLEDLMSNLRLGCDESGYDSDSTRAGADSPDSGKSVPPMLKICATRRFSITSDDYHGIDLSLPMSTPNKRDATTETEENTPGSSGTDDTVIEKNTLNESTGTDTTVLLFDGDDTDSCDEDTFRGFAEFEMSCTKTDINSLPKSDTNTVLKSDSTSLPKPDTSSLAKSDTSSLAKSDTSSLPKPDTSSLPKSDTGLSKASTVGSVEGSSLGDSKASSATFGRELSRTTEKKSFRQSVPPLQTMKSQSLQKEPRSQIPLKSRKHTKSSALNLLENAASPCKDSPPASKLCSTIVTSPLQYYSPKRTRSKSEVEGSDAANHRNKIKKSAPTVKIERPAPPPPTPVKTLIRRELKTMKLSVEKAGSLGISVERREAVRPFYVISKMDSNGEAAKSHQFRIGDEIVRVCGRRLRGMSMAEARNALRSCVGTVELQIAREPTFTFGEELGDTWGDILVRTRSDSEVWTLKEEKSNARASVDSVAGQEDSSKCKIVGALMKDGKNLSESSMERMESDCDLTVNKETEKMTGMRKFHVRKRGTIPVSCPRRATSLSMDLLTIALEKGASKKLGFSIVGGSDSNKGSMGIFVKDIMAGGQAAEEGTLKVGDEILAINGISMDGLTHAKALQTFKAAKPGKMMLHVGRRDPTHKRLCYRR